MLRKSISLAAVACFAGTIGSVQAEGFDVTVLGARGGILDGNLSAFMIAPKGDDRSVTCDAGSVVNGIRVGVEKGAFDHINVPEDSPYTKTGHIFTQGIKGYLISHAHLDHVAGLIVSSPDDSKKPIYGFSSVVADIEANYFNWQAWPNFGKSGKAPHLGKYDYRILEPGKMEQIKDTAMSVTAFPLAHGGKQSTAFMIESGGDVLLCFGDTGPDSVNKSGSITKVWEAVEQYVKAGRLKGVIIESSYDSKRPDKFLFGHLTPKYIQQEFMKLADMVGDKDKLKGLPVVISHIKYTLKKGETPQEIIERELNENNPLGLKFIIPEQGQRIEF